jgi:gliding motility-associated-like protein
LGNFRVILSHIVVLLISSYAHLFSQNLVPNPSFELFQSCPITHSLLDLLVDWENPTLANPDFFNNCAGSSCTICVPGNVNGFQGSKCGNGYIGLYVYHPPNSYREYAQVKLKNQLVSGRSYTFSFEISLADNHSSAVENIGIYLSPNSISRQDDQAFSGYTPQIQNQTGQFLDNKSQWTTISGTYIANGSERYLTIGNFLHDSLTNIVSLNTGGDIRSYYYIDNVRVFQLDSSCEDILEEDTSICFGDSISIFGQMVNLPGRYYDTIFQSNECCDFIHIKNLSVENWTNVSKFIDLNLCPGDSVLVGSVYQTEPGVYFEIIRDHKTCEVQYSSFNISTKPWEILYQSDTIEMCHGDSIFLEGNYQSEPGIFWDTLIDKPNCKKVYTKIFLVFIEGVFKKIPKYALGCLYRLAKVSATTSGASYQWNDGSTDSVRYFSKPGMVWVQRRVSNCIQIDTIIIEIADQTNFDIGRDTTICPGDSIELKISVNGGFYIWNTGEKTQSIIVTEPGMYSARLEILECPAFDNVIIEKRDLCEVILTLPNILTPNQDGLNDLFEPIEIKGIAKLKTEIFSRWGVQVAKSEHLKIQWDPGNLPAGTYFYSIKYWDFENELGAKKGTITLIK